MIDRQRLLADVQKLLGKLEADLLERSDSTAVPEIGQTLRSEHSRARQAERTAQNYEEWKDDAITQVAAAWVLSCVFARFLEDNRLIDPPKIAGLADRLQRARDEHELYFRDHPRETDRDYLLSVFNGLANLPGVKDVFGKHNPIRELPNWLSGDAAGDLLRFFQKIEADKGTLVHDFIDVTWDTRFLGDLYQDLSEAARKKYALLQTPEFVEEFILDRTLEPALDEFGLDAAPVKESDGKPITSPGFRMIDPACGSGHFLLGSFRRILNRWQKQEPGAKVHDLVQRTLDSINGVDLNPYAVAIARFRLLLASIQACGVTRLTDAPAFRFNLACGDSLLHGVLSQGFLGDWSPIAHYFGSEDIETLRHLLVPGQYHAVVANPPYITPKDSALSEAYRERYSSCYRQYSLAVPFIERMFQLCVDGGFTGEITANSFMKREFGKKLIEGILPTVDVTHVIDTSGAYIPGHGTPTVILLGRNRSAVAGTIRTARGILGEPNVPTNPTHGQVWLSLLKQIDDPGSESRFFSVDDSQRSLFHKHPWTLSGGGATDLLAELNEHNVSRLRDHVTVIGRGGHTGADETFVADWSTLLRNRIGKEHITSFVEGECIRDWQISTETAALFPYNNELALIPEWSDRAVFCRLWPFRNQLWQRREPNGTHREIGKTWYELSRFHPERYRGRGIGLAFVATHNHFSLSQGNRLFNRSAPIIKLRSDSDDDACSNLLGVLNSSCTCFWLKQVSHNKGSSVDQHGARQTTVAFENFWEFTTTQLLELPIPERLPRELTKQMELLAIALTAKTPGATLHHWQQRRTAGRLRYALSIARKDSAEIRGQMIARQEELDWECYHLYGILEEKHGLIGLSSSDRTIDNLPRLQFGQRAFEIALGRKMAKGEIETTWFERHGTAPITEIPVDWPADYRRLVEHRIDIIEIDSQIALLEQPEYKRRWNTEPWESQLERALCEWLLNRLETYFDFDGRMNNEAIPTAKLGMALTSVAKLVDIARQDADFMEVGEIFRDDAAFDVYSLVAELLEAESVPLLAVLRYKDGGLRKRRHWEETWDLQRHEDTIDARSKLAHDVPQYLSPDQARELRQREVGDIPIPPKYSGTDFLKNHYWRLRGKLDVPKERWVSFPHCAGQDGTLVIAWAGYDHLQLARAISTYYVDIQERQGGREDARLVPLLACVIDLLPWIKQWHNDPNPDFNGMRMGDYFEGFVQDEARQMGKTVEEIKSWEPPQRSGRRSPKTTT